MIKILFLTISFLFPLYCSAEASLLCKGNTVILFEQSGNPNFNNSKHILKKWLSTFAQELDASKKIMFVGFGERIHLYLDAPLNTTNNLGLLYTKIDKIMPFGNISDLERSMKFLLELKEVRDLCLVILALNGVPNLWDINKELSIRIRDDNRYKDLEKELSSLKSAGMSNKEIYSELFTSYQERNEKFIEDAAAQLKEILGKKVIVWDRSGESQFLRRFSKLSKATYIPIKAGINIVSEDELQPMMMSLDNATHIALGSSPSENKSQKKEEPLVPLQAPSKEILVASSSNKCTSPWTFPLVLAVIVAFGMLIIWGIKSYKNERKALESERMALEKDRNDFQKIELAMKNDMTENELANEKEKKRQQIAKLFMTFEEDRSKHEKDIADLQSKHQKEIHKLIEKNELEKKNIEAGHENIKKQFAREKETLKVEFEKTIEDFASKRTTLEENFKEEVAKKRKQADAQMELPAVRMTRELDDLKTLMEKKGREASELMKQAARVIKEKDEQIKLLENHIKTEVEAAKREAILAREECEAMSAKYELIKQSREGLEAEIKELKSR